MMNGASTYPNDLANSVNKVANYWHDDPYYARAEQADWLDVFWARDNGDRARPFRRLFADLNLRTTAELAVGHGRHAAQIVDQVPALILLDVVGENAEYCRQRFANRANVVVVQNDGSTFRPIPDGALTAVYSYDAMVHFEYDVVLSYVRDTARVLEAGGRALYHHSILSAFPGRDHRLNPGGRNFMSLQLFHHAAHSAGLKVLESVTMDWDAPHTDALTLLEKVG